MCARCRQAVLVCSACDSRRIYCSSDCSEIRRQESLKQARKRYQNSPIGALKHAARQSRYRARKKIVTDHSSLQSGESALLLQNQNPVDEAAINIPSHLRIPQNSIESNNAATHRCHFCGKVGSRFVRIDVMRSVRASRTVMNV